MTAPLVIQLQGRVVSKKNMYTPRKDGKGFFKNTDLQTQIDRLAMQIPGWARDLKLEHPELHFHFTYTTANWDVDGAMTTLLDLMVEYGVLFNDNIAHCNGRKVIEEAERGEYDSVKIVIFPKAAEEAAPTRYIDPRRRKYVQTPPINVTPLERVHQIMTDTPPAVDLAKLEDYQEADSPWEW